METIDLHLLEMEMWDTDIHVHVTHTYVYMYMTECDYLSNYSINDVTMRKRSFYQLFTVHLHITAQETACTRHVPTVILHTYEKNHGTPTLALLSVQEP